MQRLHGRNGVEIVGKRLEHGFIRRGIGGFRRRPFGEQAFGLFQTLYRKIDRLSIMRHQHRKTQNLARPFPAAEFLRVQQFIDRHEVALGLRHLAAFHLHKAVMHPHVRHDMRAVCATGLGDFVLVMWKDEVEPAAVNVENVTEVAAGHSRAFDMPAGTAAAPRAFPAGLVVGGKLPQHEIAGVLLVGIHRHARARLLLVQRTLRKLPVIGHGASVEQDLATGHIGVAACDQFLDDVDHLCDIVGRARFDTWLKAAQRRDVRMELVSRLFRHGVDGIVERQMRIVPQRPRIDLVINVSDVAGIGDVIFAIDMAQQPEENIEHDDGSRVADMGEIIDRRAADIHAHVFRIDGRKFRLFAGQRVVKFQAQGHAAIP